MCGIMFVVNSMYRKNAQHSIKQNALFADMLLAGAVRGTDSTGVFQIAPDETVWYGKVAQPSGSAIKDETISALIEDVRKSPITVGHVRAATAGSVNDANAHPFIGQRRNEGKDYIIGVHNGTLWGWETLDQYNIHDVDSSWAIQEIATRGVKAFEDFYGAYAMLWYDTEHPGKLFIARNNERPLYIARSKDKETIIGCSEPGMLQWLASRNSIDLEEDEPYSVDSGFLFSIDSGEEHLSIALVEELPEAYTGTTSYHRTTTTTMSVPFTPAPLAPIPYDNPTKTGVIEAVKEALRFARYEVVVPQQGDEDDMDTPFEMGPDEILLRAKDDWFSTGNLHQDDVKRAMHDGSYGSIVVFDAVDYDTYTDSVVGEIVSPAFYKRPLTYIEDVSPFEWGELENRQHTMVVAGVKWFNNEKEYIVVPLNEKGQEAIAV